MNGGTAGGSGGSGPPSPGEINISAATRTNRESTVGLNYWCWAPSFVDSVTGTETAVAALAPRFVRVGGHNNDNNKPDPFSETEIDNAVAYVRAVGGEMILQVPLLGDAAGAVPTAATAAAMVTYANVTKAYGIKYFSIGNEPDLYPDQEATLPGYKPADFCASARAFVTAMKAVDPTIKIVGPDLSWKYQAGQGANDWMTPILTGCGDLLDIVSFHRYPFAPTAAMAVAAQADAPVFHNLIASVRGIMRAAGQGDKPLALTEANITYDGAPEKSTLDASPNTVPAGLWAADMLGTALGDGLWTTLWWSLSEGWTLGLLAASSHVPRPTYYAVRAFAEHFGPTLIEVTSAPAGVRAYASRNAADAGTQVIVVNWNQTAEAITFNVAGTTAVVDPVAFTLGARTFTAVEIPDVGTPAAWTYGAQQWAGQVAPEPLAAAAPP